MSHSIKRKNPERTIPLRILSTLLWRTDKWLTRKYLKSHPSKGLVRVTFRPREMSGTIQVTVATIGAQLRYMQLKGMITALKFSKERGGPISLTIRTGPPVKNGVVLDRLSYEEDEDDAIVAAASESDDE